MQLFLVLLLVVAGARAQATESGNVENKVVIYGSGFNSTSHVILDQEAIHRSRAQNLSTLLATQANISISNTAIQPGSIFLRGGDSSHVLILVDGLPFYDASTVQRTININDLDIKTIRRIEILKGSQSVLYGGQALAGVIKIETFPKDLEAQSGAVLEGGERGYEKISGVAFRPLGDHQGVIVRAQGSQKDNRSPVLDSSETYRSKSASADLGYLYSRDFDAFFKLSQISGQNELPDSDFASYKPVDTKGFVAENNIRSLAAGLLDKKMPSKPKLLFGYQNSDRSFLQRPSADQKYGSNLWNIRFESLMKDDEAAQILVGASYLKEDFVYRDAGVEQANFFNEQRGLFAKITTDPGPHLNLEMGVRTEYYKQMDHIESFQVGLTVFENLKFEYATGFKAPSLFQLYSVYGNSDLKPEKSETYSTTYEARIKRSHFLSFTVFQTNFNDLITTQGSYPSLRYENVSRAETRGVEAQYSFRVSENFRVDAALGYQEPWDVQNAHWLLRRPLQSGSLRLTETSGPVQWGYELIGRGERLDRFSGTSDGSLSSYLISNVFLAKDLGRQTSLYVRGNNVFNERYEDSRGYFSEGAFWLTGIEISN